MIVDPAFSTQPVLGKTAKRKRQDFHFMPFERRTATSFAVLPNTGNNYIAAADTVKSSGRGIQGLFLFFCHFSSAYPMSAYFGPKIKNKVSRHFEERKQPNPRIFLGVVFGFQNP